MAESSRPTLAAFSRGAGAALVAAFLLAIVDGVTTGGGALVTVLGLWGLPAFGFALYAGAVAAGFGPGAIGRLRDDRDRDAAWASFVLAAMVVALALAIVVPTATKMIVATPERKLAGARAMGPLTMLLAIGAGLVIAPLARLARGVVRAVPLLGVPHFVTAVALAVVVLLVFARAALYGAGYENAALPTGALTQVALLPVLTLVLAAIVGGPLASLWTKLPVRGALVAVGLAAALVLGVMTLRGQPSIDAARAVTEHGLASRTFVTVYQSVLDRDGDGFSAFFRGPDCDDHDKDVNPKAKEIAGNGKDDNCQGGDRATDPTPTPTTTDGDAGVAAATQDAGVAAPAGPRKNVLIIMVDTLRVDRLGKSGYQRDGKSLTPRLDGFLDQAVWFKRTYAQANNTPRSMPSFMTSRYPSLVAVDEMHSKYPRVDDSNVMLFEQLKAAGLETLGFASHFYFRDERNFSQGFTRFDNDGALDIGPSNKDIAAPRIVPRAVAALADLGKRDQKFAMFVHLFEPHSSFVEHPGFPAITESGTKAHAQRYDYEIAFVDGWIGQLLDGLTAAGLDDDTVVVLMSDHGEAFGEHNFAGQSMFHGTNLYDEQLRVPFAFRVPGAAPRAVDDITQLIDLAPTVAELTGAAKDPSWLGRSLAPALRGEPMPPHAAYAELLPYPGWEHNLKMAVSADGAWKIINVISQRRTELYDLTTDAAEKKDRWNDASVKADRDRMQQLLLDWVEVTLAQ